MSANTVARSSADLSSFRALGAEDQPSALEDRNLYNQKICLNPAPGLPMNKQTLARIVQDISENISFQLSDKNELEGFLLTLDESRVVSDPAQVLTFIREAYKGSTGLNHREFRECFEDMEESDLQYHEGVNINVALFSYTRAFVDGASIFEP
ncbi:hypothetical protein TNCV_65081 [Trichonephila clavipes]|nr:hypothetical protein TNCV_65081 [Trichonephila clavipes]